jgi:hypothetical protein
LRSSLINSEQGVNNDANNYVDVIDDAYNNACDYVGANDDVSNG